MKKSTPKYFAPSAPPRVLHVPVDVVPLGDGTWKVIPRKPVAEVEEISTLQAAKILNLGITATKALRDSALGAKILRWRFSTPGCTVLKWERASVLEFKEATRQLGK